MQCDKKSQLNWHISYRHATKTLPDSPEQSLEDDG